MTISPFAATSASPIAANSSTTPANQQVSTTDFLTLLTGELQAQDPTNPMSPTDSITQLAQFETLGQLNQITTLLQNLLTTVQGTASNSQTGGATTTGTSGSPSSTNGTNA